MVPHAPGDHFVRNNRTRTRWTFGSQAASRLAIRLPAAPQATDDAAREATALPAPTDEAGGLPLLVLAAVLTFTVVALAAPFARRVVVSTAGTIPRFATTAPRDRPSTDSSDPPPLPAVPDSSRPKRTGQDAVGYLTVSEAAEGAKHELRRQITAMDAVCEQRGWRLVEVVRDIGDASTAPLARPGLTYALERLAGSDTASLVVAELRRLGSSAAELAGVL